MMRWQLPLVTLTALTLTGFVDPDARSGEHERTDPAAGQVPAGKVAVTGSSDEGAVVLSFKTVVTASGAIHSCGLTDAGKAYCWGDGEFGKLGNGSEDDQAVPVPVAGNYTFTALAVGMNHTCGLTAEGAAYCWGDGQHGQLGNGTSGEGTVALEPTAVGGGHQFSAIAAGDNHTCGIAKDGTALCWGYGGAGRLGDGLRRHRYLPTPVKSDSKFSAISGGHYHTCGVTTEGKAFCWGYGGHGRLGTGDTVRVVEPTAVAGDLEFTAVSVGEAHTCGLTKAGAVYCWGSNLHGKLGDGSGEPLSLVPVQIALEGTFSAVSAGYNHSCAVSTSGELYCWGNGVHGRLGNGSFARQTRPVKVDYDQKFAGVSAGKEHTCAVTAGKEGLCWGLADFGRLGNGSMDGTVAKPTPITAPTHTASAGDQ